MDERQKNTKPAVGPRPILLIMLAMMVFGACIVTGVVLGEYNRQDTMPSNRYALYKGLVVAISVSIFVIFWSLALRFRTRRLKK